MRGVGSARIDEKMLVFAVFRPELIEKRLALGAFEPGLQQPLHRHADGGIARFFCIGHLFERDRVHAPAYDGEPFGLRPRFGLAGVAAESRGQRLRQSAASGHGVKPSGLVQRPGQLLHAGLRFAVKHRDPFARVHRRGRSRAGDDLDRLAHLLFQQRGDVAFRNRLKGIDAEHALVYRDAVDVMDPVDRNAVHRRQRRDEEELALTAAVEHRGELCADVAAQRRVGLFENAADVQFRGPFRKRADLSVRRLRRFMPRRDAQHEHARVGIRFFDLREEGHLRFQTRVRKLDSGVQRAGHVIGKDQDFYHRLRCASFLFIGDSIPGWLLCPNYIGAPRLLESRGAPFCVSFLNIIFLYRFILPPATKFSPFLLVFMHKNP